MRKTSAEILDYYDEEVVKMIALREYLQSETYSMMTDSELEMWEFGASAIFEMWENEKITGNPRNSIYLRRE